MWRGFFSVMTGKELISLFRQQVSADYTTYTGGTVKENRLFKMAILTILKKGFDNIELQEARASINFLIKSDKEFLVNNNQIYEKKLEITGVLIVGLQAIITTALPHNMITGDTVTVSGITGFTVNPNGRQIISVINANSFAYPFNIVSTGAYIGGGQVYDEGKQIIDYWEMIDVNAKYNVRYDATFTTTNTTPIRLTLNKRTDLASQQQGFISGCSNTGANGDVYFRKLNDYTFTLYRDKWFEQPTVGTASSTDGLIFKTYYNTCKPFLPKTEIDSLSDGTLDYPKYKETEKLLRFFPTDRVCDKINISYYSEPPFFPDVSNDTLALELYYPEFFLTGALLNAAAILYGMEARDQLLVNNSVQNLKQAS